MTDGSKILQLAEMDRCWAELRDKSDKLSSLLCGESSKDPLDFILFYQCVVIIQANLVMSSDEYSFKDSLDKKRFEEEEKSGGILRVLREAAYWKEVKNESLRIENRLESVSKLRRSMWMQMATEIDEINKIIKIYPKVDKKQALLMMQCCFLVSLELDLREIEIELLY